MARQAKKKSSDEDLATTPMAVVVSYISPAWDGMDMIINAMAAMTARILAPSVKLLIKLMVVPPWKRSVKLSKDNEVINFNKKGFFYSPTQRHAGTLNQAYDIAETQFTFSAKLVKRILMNAAKWLIIRLQRQEPENWLPLPTCFFQVGNALSG